MSKTHTKTHTHVSNMSAVCIDHITKTLLCRQSEPMGFSICYAWNSNTMLWWTFSQQTIAQSALLWILHSFMVSLIWIRHTWEKENCFSPAQSVVLCERTMHHKGYHKGYDFWILNIRLLHLYLRGINFSSSISHIIRPTLLHSAAIINI